MAKLTVIKGSQGFQKKAIRTRIDCGDCGMSLWGLVVIEAEGEADTHEAVCLSCDSSIPLIGYTPLDVYSDE